MTDLTNVEVERAATTTISTVFGGQVEVLGSPERVQERIDAAADVNATAVLSRPEGGKAYVVPAAVRSLA